MLFGLSAVLLVVVALQAFKHSPFNRTPYRPFCDIGPQEVMYLDGPLRPTFANSAHYLLRREGFDATFEGGRLFVPIIQKGEGTRVFRSRDEFLDQYEWRIVQSLHEGYVFCAAICETTPPPALVRAVEEAQAASDTLDWDDCAIKRAGALQTETMN